MSDVDAEEARDESDSSNRLKSLKHFLKNTSDSELQNLEQKSHQLNMGLRQHIIW